MSYIKVVSRNNLPETNSSSSHSVVISMDESTIVDKTEWNLTIDDDLILYIPEFNDFGRQLFISNSVVTKLQYLSCLYLGSYQFTGGFFKACHKFKGVVGDIFGVKGIRYMGHIHYLEEVKNGNISKDDRYMYTYPSVDHESDLRNEICESKETIKNFLLNRNSWLYGGDDCITLTEGIKYGTVIPSKVIGIFSIQSKSLGRIDFELKEDLNIIECFRFLQEALVYDTQTDDIVCNTEDDKIVIWKNDSRYKSFYYMTIKSRDGELYITDGHLEIPVEFKCLDYNGLRFV